jgi:ribonuclease P protein component
MRGNPGSPPRLAVAAGARHSGERQTPLRQAIDADGANNADGAAAGDGTDAHGADNAAGERFLPHERLRRRADYLRCYRTGRRRAGALVMLYIAANSSGHPRMGVTATRKVGNSVMRHRLKRWIKEIYRRWPERSRLAAVDLVVHLKPEAKTAGHGEMEHDLLELLLSLARSGSPGASAGDGRASGGPARGGASRGERVRRETPA